MEEPCTQYLPFSQAKHRSTLFAPVVLRWVPAGQGVHIEVPDALQYDPAGQGRQSPITVAPSSLLYVPASHAVAAATPCAHHDPGGHAKHAVRANALVAGL